MSGFLDISGILSVIHVSHSDLSIIPLPLLSFNRIRLTHVDDNLSRLRKNYQITRRQLDNTAIAGSVVMVIIRDIL